MTAAPQVHPAPWQIGASAAWVPLRTNLREVEGTAHAVNLAQQKIDLAEQERKEQDQAGYDAGYARGMRAAEQELKDTRAAYAEGLGTLLALRRNVLAQSQEQLLRLSLHIAGQVLLSDVEARRQFTAAMVERALSMLQEADALSVRLPEAELKYLQHHHPDLMDLPKITWTVDKSLVLGGALVQSDLGVVDATLEHRLAQMAEQLHAVADAQAGRAQAPPPASPDVPPADKT